MHFIRQYWFWMVVLLCVALRFVVLACVPQTPYIDEVASIAQVRSLHEFGRDIHGTSLPLSTESFGGGYSTAPYLYPLVVWTTLFGTSVYAVRAFSVVVTLAAIGLIAYSLKLWGGKKLGAIGLLVGLTLPWPWIGGNLAWDTVLPPLYIGGAFLCFSLIVRATSSTRQRILLSTIMTVLLVTTAWIYPPCRAVCPLLFVGALVYLYMQRQLSLRQVVTPITVAVLASMPLVLSMMEPAVMARSTSLSIFHNQSLLAAAGQFIANIARLLNPVTLFATGDANLRHSTGLFGMLGLASLPAAIILLWKACRHHLAKDARQLCLIGVYGVICGLIGSALTNEGSPHYLRAVAAWPFFVVLLSVGWLQVLALPKRYCFIIVGFAGLVIIAYIVSLILLYPNAAAGSFSPDPHTAFERQVLDYYSGNRTTPW